MRFDWFSFVLGFVLAVILAWLLLRITAWLGSIFKPAQAKSSGAGFRATLRSLFMGLLILVVAVLLAYLAYSVLLT